MEEDPPYQEQGEPHSEEARGASAISSTSTSTPWAAAAFRPETMVLTRGEANRALSIKQAADPTHHLSDFEYAQYALCCPSEEPLEEILHRMEMIRAYKEEYKLLDTPEDAVDVVHQLEQCLPGFLLSISYLPASQNFLSVIDWAQLFPAQLKTPEQQRAFFGYLYYTVHAKCCQFQAIREGSSILVECMDITLQNFDSELFAKQQHEFLRWYPKLQKEIFLLNSPTVANVAFGLWKRFARRDEKKAIHFGHRIDGLEGQRIDEFYKVPTAEAAHQQLLLCIQAILQHRYQMEEEFVLPDEPLEEDELLYYYLNREHDDDSRSKSTSS